jgi:hypothetical protein
MQSAKDRGRLQESYGGDEPRPLLAVVKCVVGLVALCAVASAPWLIAGSGGGSAGMQIAPEAPAYSDSMAESKRVFDERRARYEGSAASAKASALAQDLKAQSERTPGAPLVLVP